MEGIFHIIKPKTSMGLSVRELEVLELMAEGWDNSVIAEKLFIDKRTVTHHQTTIYSKIAANNDMEGRNKRVFAVVLYLLSKDLVGTINE